MSRSNADNAMPAGAVAEKQPLHSPLAEGDPGETDTVENFTHADDDTPDAELDGFEGEFEADDDWDDPAEAPRVSHPDESPAAEKSTRVHGGARGANSAAGIRPLPPHLESLCALPGVERELFELIDCRRAVVDFFARKPRAKAEHKLPLGHLAPDALEVLADEFGFQGHVRGAVYASAEERHPAFQFAFRMPGEVDTTDARESEAELIALELREEVSRMREEMRNQTPLNPLHGIKEFLGYIRETIREVGEIKNEIAEMSGLDLDAEPGEEAGGTREAMLALIFEKGRELLGSESAKALAKHSIAWIKKQAGGDLP